MKDKKESLKSIVIDPVHEYLIKEISRRKIKVDYEPRITETELIRIISDYDILIGRNRMRIKKELINKAKKLKLVVRAGTGTENIDKEHLKQRGIALISAPGSSTESVAELAICLMIMAARDIFSDVNSLKRGLFRKEMGAELSGKTLGVIGLGRIGSRIVELSRPFNMRIIANDVIDLRKKAEAIGAVFAKLSELLSKADIIIISASMEDGGKPMIGRKAFGVMKDGVIIVNVVRATAVDMTELRKNIESRKVGFYATDVLWNEPPKTEKEKELIKGRRFIATSHIGAQTAEAQKRIAEAIVDSMTEWLNKTK